MTFKCLFETLTGFDPFKHGTIALACNRDQHMNDVILNSVASKPEVDCDHQLRCQALKPKPITEDLEVHDLMAHSYLNHPHPTRRHYIQHVSNGGEHQVSSTPFTVNHFHPDTNTVYKFHSYFWHGCPTFYPVCDEHCLHL